jgi:uncharacterized protein
MDNIIGREAEIKVLQEALASPSAELIAVYGRRRVGKTYLIETVYQKELILVLTGLNNAPFSEQLENFSLTLTRTFGLPMNSLQPQTWLQAFHILMQLLEPRLKEGKKGHFN